MSEYKDPFDEIFAADARQLIYSDGTFKIVEILRGNWKGTMEVWKVRDDEFHPDFKGSFGGCVNGLLSVRIRESIANNELPDLIVGFITLSTM